ncbi:MAG TPA: hypothetical protein VFG68_07710, partial [Fimbriiglobus sp.]|nr:hypothetical protein [Fimbriiglobus sp.]
IRATPKVSADRRFVELRLNYQTVQPNRVVLNLGNEGAAGERTATALDVQTVDAKLAFLPGKTVMLAGPVVARKQVVARKPVPGQAPLVIQPAASLETRPMTCRQLILVKATVLSSQGESCCAACSAADCKACPAECQTVAATKPARPADAEVSRLVAAYHKACADGRTEEALKLAMQALARDPSCFADEK